jgi:hypothetical protein
MKRSVPPMTYWHKEDKPQPQVKAMDTIGITAVIIAALGLITVLAVNEKIYWLPVIIAVVTVVWWLGWGRHKYE